MLIPCPALPDLHSQLWELVAAIPRGQVSTYGDLANALGSVSATRWVGEALLRHRHTATCHCHRVVRHTGELGLYWSGDTEAKCAALELEGIEVRHGALDLQRHRFSGFRADRPLQELRQHQLDVAARVQLPGYGGRPGVVGALDVSYARLDDEDAGTACATLAVVETRTLQLIDSMSVIRRIRFPYIPGFLTFREAPLLLDVLRQFACRSPLPTIILVDGNGLLHPHRAGLATYVGVQSGLRCIGIGKSQLCGAVQEGSADGAAAVSLDGDIVGFRVPPARGTRPIYVSPGHRISPRSALRITRMLCSRHRVPEPICFADKISRQQLRSSPVADEVPDLLHQSGTSPSPEK